jgi:hypothetical protein
MPRDPTKSEHNAIRRLLRFLGFGVDPDDPIDDRVTMRLALRLAEHQLADRSVRTEVLHTVIAKYVAAARKANPSRGAIKQIVSDAAAYYEVSEDTVWKVWTKFTATK